VIVMEMTAQHALVLPLMVTAALATAVSKLITPPLYQTLADRYTVPGTGPAPSPSGVHITPGERQG
jgi:H+/Cl- antiporter ClcA